MITSRNYAAQAEARLRYLASTTPRYDTGDGLAEFDMKMAAICADAIKDSVHFALPDGGKLLDDGLKGLRGMTLRLPYPAITVEYFVPDHLSRGSELANTLSPRRVALAIEVKRDEMERVPGVKWPIGDCELAIQVVVMNEIDGVWLPCAMSMLIPTDWDNWQSRSATNFAEPLIERKSDNKFFGAPLPAFPGLHAFDVARVGDDYAMRCAIHDISGEVAAVFALCEALACSNVATEQLQAESASLNARRKKKGKLPIYETKVLTIVTQRNSSKGGGAIGIDRSGPRQHLRRGHIRRISDNRMIWVNSCIVGAASAGVIEKSYAVSTT